MMTSAGRSTLNFDGYHVPSDVDLLYRGAEVIALEPRAVRLLRYLLTHSDRVLTKQELLEEVWSDVFTADGVLKKAISQIRRAIGGNADAPRYIETYHGRGYRFVAPVQRIETEARRRGTLPETQRPRDNELVPDYDQFYGRETQLAALRAEFASAVKGNPRPVLIVGESGIGKTQLARNFCRWAREQHAMTLYGRFFDYRGSRLGPYQMFLDVLAQAVHALGGGGDLWQELADRCGVSLPSELFTESDATSRVTAGATIDRSRLTVPIARCFRALAVTRPVVVVVDDLQWADDVSLEILGFIMRLLESEALMMILLVRDEERQEASVRTWLQEHAVHRSYTTLRLAGLDEAACNEIVGAIFKARRSGEIPPGDLERLHHLTGGNPYFLVETLRVVVAEQAIVPDPERRRWIWKGIGQLTLPESIVNASRARIDRLSSTVLELVEEAAVIGDELRIATLSLVDGRSDAELEPLLEEAVRGGILSIQGLSRGEDCRFQHSILRHVIYDSIAPQRKRRLHASAAAATEQLYKRDRERVAEAVSAHWAAASDARKTFESSLYAWDVAIGRSEWRKAAALIERADEAAAELTLSGSERVRLLVAKGEASLAKGDIENAARLLHEASKRAETGTDRTMLARALLLEGQAESAAARYIAAREILDRARALFAELAIPQAVFRATIELANVDNALGEPQAAVALLIGVLQGRLTDDLTALAQGLLGWSLALCGDADEGCALLRKAIDYYGSAGDLRQRSLLLRRLESIHRSRGDYESSIRLAVRARADAIAVGDVAGEARANIGIGRAKLAQGLEQEGRSFVTRAIERLHILDRTVPPPGNSATPAIVDHAMTMVRNAGARADEV